MKLESTQFPFVLLTVCFSGTAEGKTAQSSVMRVPPIRGHIRFWHRVLFDADSANRIWGSTAGNGGSSLVALRLNPAGREETRGSRLLPHVEFTPAERDEYRRLEGGSRENLRFKELKQKKAKAESQRPALQPQGQFTLTLQRLVGCKAADWSAAQIAVKVWLLVGCLGLRSNRAAGSIWPINPPPPQPQWVPGDLNALVQTLRNSPPQGGLGLRWAGQLADPSGSLSAEQVRAIASDTRDGSPQFFGSIRPQRQPSPLKLKVVYLSGRHCLLALAQNAQTIHGALQELNGKRSWSQLRWQNL